jgi:hypothetical protein
MRAWQKEMKAGRETTELPPKCKGPTSEDMEPVVKAPKEEATVRSSGALKKRHRGQHLVTSRNMTSHARVAWRKRNIRKNRTRNQVERGALKGWEETVKGPRMQNLNKEPGHKTAAVSENQDNTI